jgi:hypothetical protein
MRLTSAGLLGLGTSTPGALLDASSATGSASPTPTEIRIGTTTSASDWSTTDPWGRLSYYSADGSGGGPKIHAAIDAIAAVNTGSTSGLSFKITDGSANTLVERVRITNGGLVGIGSTSPSVLLHIEQTSPADGRLARIVSAGVGAGFLGVKSTGNTFIDANTSATALEFRTQDTERARIDSSGRLLVGTSSSPSSGDSQYARLRIQGNTLNNAGFFAIARNEAASALVSGSEIGQIFFTDNAGNGFATIKCEADATAGSNDYPGRLVFSTTADGASSPTERMRIQATGNAGILCASGSDPLYLNTPEAAGTSRYFIYAIYEGSTTTGANGTNSFRVYTNGNVQNTNNSYGQISDIKLKENIVDASSQWGDLKAVRVRNFNFKEGQTHRQIGVIAQELEDVSPGLVYETPDRDEEGNETGEVTKGVNYSVLYMKAVKALQEAMERIEILEAKVAALEAS